MIKVHPNFWQRTLLIFNLLVISLVVGCSVTPMALDTDEITDQLILDRNVALNDIEPLSGPLTLDEAVARAVKYNLDFRVSMIEQSIAFGQLDLSRYDMLPQLLANAGYTTQNKPSEQTQNSDLSSWNYSLRLSWSLLDFGSSYYKARQNANNLLSANEQRRRAMHLLIMDVESAFWRLATAQALNDQLLSTGLAIENAIAALEREQDINVQSPVERLRNLRELLVAQITIKDVQEELNTAKLELANLINAPAAELVVLADIDTRYALSEIIQIPLEELEFIALHNNAELSVQFYESRNAALETRRAIIDLLPGLYLDWTQKYSTDTAVVNDSWNESALTVTWNLFNILRIRDVQNLSNAREDLATIRRIAMQMAVVTQMHIARIELENARQNLAYATRLSNVDNEIELNMMRGGLAGIHSESEVLLAHTSAIVSKLRKYRALAGFYAAESRLKSSLGLEPRMNSVHTATIMELSAAYRDAQEQWRSGAFLKTPIGNHITVPSDEQSQ